MLSPHIIDMINAPVELSNEQRSYMITLIQALRSGDYHQTLGRLRRGGSFCCLGVACDLYDPARWNYSREYDGYRTNPPVEVQEAYGFLGEDAHLIGFKVEELHEDLAGSKWFEVTEYYRSLTGLNDDNFSFNQIADVIEWFYDLPRI
jgi:hypothetical protein